MDITLFDLKRLLGIAVPTSYTAYVASTDEATLFERRYDPKTISILNLIVRSTDRDGWSSDKFLISEDGLGNYYFIEDEAPDAKVLLWSHDPEGIEDTQLKAIDFLHTTENGFGINNEVPQDSVYLSRADYIGESILAPISLDEWKAAIDDTPSIQYLGYLEMNNPFTGKTTRIDWPGLAHAEIDNTQVRLKLNSGRIEITEPPRSAHNLWLSLSTILDARVFIGQ